MFNTVKTEPPSSRVDADQEVEALEVVLVVDLEVHHDHVAVAEAEDVVDGRLPAQGDGVVVVGPVVGEFGVGSRLVDAGDGEEVLGTRPAPVGRLELEAVPGEPDGAGLAVGNLRM